MSEVIQAKRYCQDGIVLQHSFRSMGGPCHLKLMDDSSEKIKRAFISAEAECQRLNNKYSRFLEGSVLSQINFGAGVIQNNIDKETIGLLNYALTCFEVSDGLFDITSGILNRIWDFKNNKIPQQKVIDEYLPFIGLNYVEWGESSILLPKNMALDFGGIVKEYAVDRVKAILISEGIQSGYIDFAGDISAIGPISGQSSIQVGVKDPQSPQDALATIPLTQQAIATSGSYERFIDNNGEEFCHILNPITGWPVKYCSTVSVVADSCLVAGSMATTAMLKEQEAEAWLKQQGAIYYMKANQAHFVS